MKKSLVIFDLDGTLLYTVPDIAAATNQALAACGYPVHSEAEIASYIGNGINKLFERALPEASRSQEEVLRIRSLFLPYHTGTPVGYLPPGHQGRRRLEQIPPRNRQTHAAFLS